ncbi:MAG: hypothetical protein WC868_00080 [Bacteroidales bacterium]
MKAIFKLIIFSSVIIAFIMIFSMCNKDEDMPVVITVKMQNDTNIIVPSANVKITKGPKTTTIEGVTDAYGQFRHTYKLEAIFDVFVDKDTLTGATIIRLKPGETVYKTVFIY